MVVTIARRREIMPPVFLGVMGLAAGLQVRVEGTPRPGALLLANHVSWLDILALAGTSQATNTEPRAVNA